MNLQISDEYRYQVEVFAKVWKGYITKYYFIELNVFKNISRDGFNLTGHCEIILKKLPGVQ